MIRKTDAEWRKQLTREQYRVTRKAGTERAFSGEYWDCHEDGVYACVCCGAELFDSAAKFESGTGWPSFYEPLEPGRVGEAEDNSFRCGAWRCRARAAKRIWATCFPTARRPPASATA